MMTKNENNFIDKDSSLRIFQNNIFGEIRTIIIDNEPWFVGKDVAQALGYSNSSKAVISHVDDEDKEIKMLPTSQNGNSIGKTYIINESGLYSLIFGSKLPSAKEFKRWVTSDILPQIRKTGGYIPINTQDDELTILAKAHLILERTLEEKDKIIESKSKALSIAQPKADKYDKLISAEGYMSFNVVAKQLGTGRNRLMKLLRDKKILFRDGLSNIAYQTYCDSGYFVVKYSTGRNGFACGVTKVTPKGLSWLFDILNDLGYGN